MAGTKSTNAFDSYDAVGIREDLSDIIHDVSPSDTPMYSACAKTKVRNTFAEWQTDALRSSADNFWVEGSETAAEAASATVRLGNYTQIFKNAVTIPGTDEGLDKAGRAKEMAYQTVKIAAEQKLDIEKALFDNQARAAGDSSNGRRLAGLPSWIITNVDEAADATAATGNGTDARTDGTAAAFSQTRFDGVMQSIWESGGKPDTVYLSAYQMNIALGFDGNNNQRSNITAESEKVIKHMSVYVTPWGTVKFVPSREQRGSDVFVIQDDMFAVGVLRPTKNEALAKDGDYEKRQVITELTLISKNEKASGAVYDCSTS